MRGGRVKNLVRWQDWGLEGSWEPARESEEPSRDEVGSPGASSVEEDAEEESSAGEESG